MRLTGSHFRRVYFRSVTVLVLCLLLALPNAFGWNYLGHMAVAYVAYQQLTPRKRLRVSALLRLNPEYRKWLTSIPAGATKRERDAYIFMIASTWPDLIKGTIPGYTDDGNTPPPGDASGQNVGYDDKLMHKYWHYVDVPFSPDGTLEEASAVNAESQIRVLRKGLGSEESDALKSYDLVWVEHLVGDMHQPLHATSRFTAATPKGDAGGNMVKLAKPLSNLHGYWDSLLGPGSIEDVRGAVAAARRLEVPHGEKSEDLDEKLWVAESFELAKNNVYFDPPIGAGVGPYTIPAGGVYDEAARAVAQKQIALAGVRLANVINRELR